MWPLTPDGSLLPLVILIFFVCLDNTDYVDVLFVFILPLALHSVTFCSTDIKASD